MLTVLGCLDEEKKGGITGSMGRGDGDGRSHREEGQHVDNYWSSSEWQALLPHRRNSVCMDLTFLCIQLVLFPYICRQRSKFTEMLSTVTVIITEMLTQHPATIKVLNILFSMAFAS